MASVCQPSDSLFGRPMNVQSPIGLSPHLLHLEFPRMGKLLWTEKTLVSRASGMTYDATRHQIVLFGGWTGVSERHVGLERPVVDTIGDIGPSARQHTLAFDSIPNASLSSAATVIRRFWLTPGNGTAQNGHRWPIRRAAGRTRCDIR
jgi:hypothetical protein